MNINDKNDLLSELLKIQEQLSKIRHSHYDLLPVTEFSSIKCISFNIEQESMLKDVGALSKCPNWEYGYRRSNETNSKINNELYAIHKKIDALYDWIRDCNISPVIHFTEAQRSLYQIITGGNQKSRILRN